MAELLLGLRNYRLQACVLELSSMKVQMEVVVVGPCVLAETVIEFDNGHDVWRL